MRVFVSLCVAFGAFVAVNAYAANWYGKKTYPLPYRDDTVIDNYFGEQVKDPYRWLENPNSPETKKFIEDENKVTLEYLQSSTVRQSIKDRLTELWDYTRYSTPVKSGSKYYYLKNTGLMNQDALYVQDSLNGEARIFLDPNVFAADGSLSIAAFAFSGDGRTLAYGLSRKGSDWLSICFRDVETGKDYPEMVKYVKFSKISWTNDNKGIFYSRYPEEVGDPLGYSMLVNRDHKLYYHRVNTMQWQDELIFEYPQKPLWRVTGTVSDDGRYLIVYPQQDSFFNMVYYTDLSAVNYQISSDLKFIPLITDLDANYNYITHDGSVLVFRTDKNAPNYKLVAIDLMRPEQRNWRDLVPEQKDVLNFVFAVDEDKLVMHYIREVKSCLELRSLRTGEYLKQFDLDYGTIDGFFGSRRSSEIFYHFTSFFTPGEVFYLDFSKEPHKPRVFLRTEIKGFNPSLYEAKQIYYTSKDGTKIPMYIVNKKGLIRNGDNPVLLTAYGGFGVNVQPKFSLFFLVFMQNFNGILAMANCRGGGEFGERWHDAGRLLNKQNALDDFQAAAEYLIDEKYTKPWLIGIESKYGGAVLLAASVNQRPDLFGAVIVRMGVMDMLRYHKFTLGAIWASDFGTSENKTQFHNLMKYSPLHNICTPPNHRFEYPATMVVTGDYDDRVVPAHSLKYIATLQYNMRNVHNHSPLLARIGTNAGHDTEKSTTKIIEEFTDLLTFLWEALEPSPKD